MDNQKTRRLAAIMFTDIVGYTALMQQDENAAAAIRAHHRREFQQCHEKFNGEILQYFGDGTLSIFQSGVEAVECAIAIQKALNNGINVPLRIGLHIGDIVFDGTEIYGDSVNVAARIESMGITGGVLLSGKLNEELKNQQQISTQSLGFFEFKNIENPIEVFSVSNDGIKVPKHSELKGKRKQSTKSIAVLPFVNMSADPENEYFSDGITEEIINALTTVKGLKIIARTSSFAFKNKNIDVRTIGNQLGVSTVLEGSVRKAKNRVRITAQLISTNDGTHFWSKNFDRDLEDIFALQDEISLLIADQIRENFGHLNIQEHLIVEPTQNMEAYNLYLKGRYQQLMWDGQGIANAVKIYEQCVTIDPSFALPYFGLAFSYAMYGSWGNNKGLLQLSEENLSKGFKLDKQSYIGYFSKGTLSFWGHWDFINAHKSFQKAIELNPSYTEGEECLCELYSAVGYFEKARWHADNILKINPLSPHHYFTKANIHYLNEDYTKALECIETSLSINPDFKHSIALKQLCLILSKDYEKLNDFLGQTPLAEKPEECRVLYKLVNPEDKIDIDISRVSLMIKEDIGAALFPWQLFLLVHLDKHEMALDFLEENVRIRTGQIINFMNIPLLKPLHRYQRFQDLVQSTFPIELLPDPVKQIRIIPPKALMSVAEIDMVLEIFEKGMKEEKWFQNPSLSLRELAENVNISSNKLSWLLNERIGQNFNEYINSFRVENFKENALNPANSHLTLLALAYESGFNSKSVFNTFFKKIEGMTPKAWLKSNQI